MAEHTATVLWEYQDGEFLKGRYSREHTWTFDGGFSMSASPAPAVVPAPWSNPAFVDPEEAFVASLSSCHMLTFLHLASRKGFEVDRYEDTAVGIMAKNEKGIPWVSRVELRPYIKFGGEKVPTSEDLDSLHHMAHEQCFIANSVKRKSWWQCLGDLVRSTCHACLMLLATGVCAFAGIRYVSIGDSYSIGEGAEVSWPTMLARHLTAEGLNTELVANPSRTGWTTQQAIDEELPVLSAAKPDFATLQIGVNDWVQRVPAEKFRERFVLLLDQMLETLGNSRKMIVVTIPDFSVTPAGASFGPREFHSKGLAGFNAIILEEAAARKVPVVDVFVISQKMGADHGLVSSDGLHPSAREYEEWEKLIFPVAKEMLSGKSGLK